MELAWCDHFIHGLIRAGEVGFLRNHLDSAIGLPCSVVRIVDSSSWFFTMASNHFLNKLDLSFGVVSLQVLKACNERIRLGSGSTSNKKFFVNPNNLMSSLDSQLNITGIHVRNCWNHISVYRILDLRNNFSVSFQLFLTITYKSGQDTSKVFPLPAPTHCPLTNALLQMREDIVLQLVLKNDIFF